MLLRPYHSDSKDRKIDDIDDNGKHNAGNGADQGTQTCFFGVSGGGVLPHDPEDQTGDGHKPAQHCPEETAVIGGGAAVVGYAAAAVQADSGLGIYRIAAMGTEIHNIYLPYGKRDAAMI